jgi:hypothetical protein
MKGNHQKATVKYIEILLETIEKEPQIFYQEIKKKNISKK